MQPKHEGRVIKPIFRNLSCIQERTSGKTGVANFSAIKNSEAGQRGKLLIFLGMHLKGNALHFYEQLSLDVQQDFERASKALKKKRRGSGSR